MPKPPPIEYFEITLKCPKEMLGEVVSDFNRRGLTEVNFNLVTAVATFKGNRHAPVNGVASSEFLTEWIKDHPTFRAKDAVEAFKADGRSGTACYPALHTLVEKGVLKKLAPGEYSRTDVKALPKPAKVKKAKRVEKKPKVVHEISASDFAMRVISRNHGKISSSTLKGHFEKDNRAPTGVGPVLSQLVAKKKIRSLGEGMYELAKTAPKKTEPVTNGHAIEPSSTAPGV